MTSLVSANGPSLTSISPSRTATVLASCVGASRSPSSRMPRAITSSSQGKLSSSAAASPVPVASAVPVASSCDCSTQTSIMNFIVFSDRLGTYNTTTNGNRQKDRCAQRDHARTGRAASSRLTGADPRRGGRRGQLGHLGRQRAMGGVVGQVGRQRGRLRGGGRGRVFVQVHPRQPVQRRAGQVERSPARAFTGRVSPAARIEVQRVVRRSEEHTSEL